MFLQFLLYSKVTLPPIHSHFFFFSIFHQILAQESGDSSLGGRVGPHYPSILNVTVCIHQPQTLCQSPTFSVSFCFVLFFCLFAISSMAPLAYGGSQARGHIEAVAAGLHQSHSNAGSVPVCSPTDF